MTQYNYVFNTTNFDKFFLGADRIFQNLNRVQKEISTQANSYPPYNIIKQDEDTYVIEMALAGFTKNNIDIEVAEKVLTIKGGLMTVNDMAEETVNPVTYVYKGIADRSFTRKFTLADTVEIVKAELVNGMLKIWLQNVIPDDKKPRKIDILEATEVKAIGKT